MDKVRVGIIGAGQIGKHHMDAYSKIEGAQMVAVADINEAEARGAGERWSIPNVLTDFRALLARDDIQAVDVCLHNNFHAPVTIAALRAGKHVYCEKPMAGSYADAKAMMDTAKDCKRQLSIQLSTLFCKETKAAKKLIDAGRLGHLYHARSTGFRRRGRPFVDGYGTASFVKKSVAAGGALYDMGVYHIAQVLFLLGLPAIERISGKTYQETAMDEGRRASSGYDVEELGLGFVRMAGGLTLDIIEAWAIHLGGFDGSCIAGSAGGVRLNPFGFYCHQDDMPMDATLDLGGADWRWHQLVATESAYDSPQHHWIAALQGVVPLWPCAAAALDTMLISEGIYLSNARNSEVTAEEVRAASRSTAAKL